MSVHLVSVDWGTSSLRLKALGAGGRILGARAESRGIMNCAGQSFAAVLGEELAGLLGGILPAVDNNAERAGRALAVVMSGMIGSRQGWAEAAYLRCPAAPEDLAGALLPVAMEAGAGGPFGGLDVRIVPGMDTVDHLGLPDVMRGEETQVLGAMLVEGPVEGGGRGHFILPGTHSKRVTVEAGRITGFRTFMTGEVFQALIEHTIIGRLADGRAHDDAAFMRGVETALATHRDGGGPGDLMGLAFSARTRALAGDLPETQVASYLSGVLIGAELASHLAAGGVMGEALDERLEIPAAPYRLIGDGALRDLYLAADRAVGLGLRPVEGEIVAAAHWAIAAAAGMLPETSGAAAGAARE